MLRWTLVSAVCLGALGCKKEPPPTCEALMAHANRLYQAVKDTPENADENKKSENLMLTMRASMCTTLSDDQKRCVVASKALHELESCNLPEGREAKAPVQ